jgi:hypothetical protein
MFDIRNCLFRFRYLPVWLVANFVSINQSTQPNQMEKRTLEKSGLKVSALSLRCLTVQALQQINDAASQVKVEVNRYPDALEKTTGL